MGTLGAPCKPGQFGQYMFVSTSCSKLWALHGRQLGSIRSRQAIREVVHEKSVVRREFTGTGIYLKALVIQLHNQSTFSSREHSQSQATQHRVPWQQVRLPFDTLPITITPELADITP